MKIIVDENIPLADELFGDMGKLVRLPGREIKATDCRDADVLLVRSLTSVNESLLNGSQVKFVGSCTIGIDHLDTTYLQRQNIQWANAPGCNANAVVQYVLSAMAYAQPHWLTKKVGIIGCGNIGHRLYQCLRQLGVDCYCYDPFLSEPMLPKKLTKTLAKKDDIRLVSFEDVLQADIITCHTPLSKAGPYPTYHLLSEPELVQLQANTLLINSSRGAVVDNSALSRQLAKRSFNVVLDVWENEPHIDKELLQQTTLATPHIAGYSLEGKEQGTWMIYKALSEFLLQAVNESKRKYLHRDCVELTCVELTLPKENESGSKADEQYLLNQLLLQCYSIEQDDKMLRDCLPSVDGCFDQLRKNYIPRREYSHFVLPQCLSERLSIAPLFPSESR